MKLMGRWLLLSSVLFSFEMKAVTTGYQLAKNQILRIGNGTEPKELDPAITTGVPESHIIDNLFEGLTTIDPFSQEVKPGVAESWTTSEDGLTYTFTLRKNAKWSDGKNLTAHDFVWAWERALNPNTASEYAYQLYYIKNGESYNQNKIKDFTQLGVKAVNDDTLVVTLENPTPFFLRLTAFHTLYPTPKHVITKFKDEWTKEGNMVSNGAFKLAEWKLNKHVKLVPNEHYWDKARVTLKEAYIYPIENADTEEKTFLSGDLDLTSTVPTMKIPAYNQEKTKNPDHYHPYQVNPYLGTYYYRFNTAKKPTDDARVRKALTLTVDRTLIVERITKGGQMPLSTFTPPNVGGYTYDGPSQLPTTVTEKEINEAKKLLAEAGYPDGKGMPTIEILYNTSEAHKKIAIAIQQMWKKYLGIDAKLYNQEWKVYLDTTRSGNYTVARAGWIADYPDPNTFLDMWVTNGGNNQTGWSNKEYDKLIDLAASTNDQSKRFEYFKQAEKILLDELPVLPVYGYTKTNLISQKVKMVKNDGTITNWTSNPSDRLQLKYYALIE